MYRVSPTTPPGEVILSFVLDTTNCCAKFKVPIFTRYGNTKGDTKYTQEGLAVASIARNDFSPLPGMHRDPMHFRHRQTDGQTDTDII